MQRMQQRRISPDAVAETVRNGEIVGERRNPEYPGEIVYTVLAFPNGAPLHVVVCRIVETAECRIVTVYRPEEEEWGTDFRRRRK